jgi:RimJ/RimL family protein N-acetyltransferase
MPSPTLQTERLRLRPPALADFSASLDLWSNPVVTQYISGGSQSRETVWARLLRYIGHWQALGFGYWMVETQDGTPIGEVGFGDFHREITPDIAGIPEIGWALQPAAHGQGYATEAAGAAMAWRKAALPHGPTVCIIDPAHTASLAVAARLGFMPWADTLYHARPTRLLRHMPLASAVGTSKISQ